MKRIYHLLYNEFRLFRTAALIHVVIMMQPTVMYLLMSLILVHPTFDVQIVAPANPEGQALLDAMYQVGSPIGAPYIHPILVDNPDPAGGAQTISVEPRDGVMTAVQRFGFIDSNMVKNYRNRLTAAGLRLWSEALGSQTVSIEERPWLPRDVPYTLYFGLAMLPMTVFLSASVLGGILTAQDFEFSTITEYRLAPVSPWLILGARLARLALTGLLAAGLLFATVAFVAGGWPDSILLVILILAPIGVIAGCLGICAGLLLRRTIPCLVVGLATTILTWLLGSAFGLAAGFGGGYEFLSHFAPNTYAVELLFRRYYGIDIGSPLVSVAVLALASVAAIAVAGWLYRRRVLAQEV